MRDSDGSKRPWRPTADQCQPERNAPTSPVTHSQTVMAIASAIGANSAQGQMETLAIAPHPVKSVAMAAHTSSQLARIASASLRRHDTDDELCQQNGAEWLPHLLGAHWL